MIIEARNLSKKVIFNDQEIVILDDINLEVSASSSLAVIGPSGSGKSTLLGILAGLDSPSSGEIFINQKPLHNLSEDSRAKIRKDAVAFVFQNFELLAGLNALENVMLPIELKGKKNARDIAETYLEKVGMQNRLTHYPQQLSGGEQQRVALARAISSIPMVMLMDEPFSGLDKRLRDEIRDETIEILRNEGVAVLIVTHEPEEAMNMADNIALMRDGKIIQQGAPYNIYNKPIDKNVASFFSDINTLHSKVKDGRTETPFGPFITPGFKEGSSVEIIIRPQHLKIDFDRNGKGPSPTIQDGVPARGKVSFSRFIGKESIIELIMERDGSKLKASIPGVFLPDAETPLWLSMRRDRCFVFLK